VPLQLQAGREVTCSLSIRPNARGSAGFRTLRSASRPKAEDDKLMAEAVVPLPVRTSGSRRRVGDAPRARATTEKAWSYRRQDELVRHVGATPNVVVVTPGAGG